MYPRLKIYLKRIEENTRVVRQLCAGHGIRVMGVTKACCGAPELAKAYLAGGLAMVFGRLRRHPDPGFLSWRNPFPWRLLLKSRWSLSM